VRAVLILACLICNLKLLLLLLRNVCPGSTNGQTVSNDHCSAWHSASMALKGTVGRIDNRRMMIQTRSCNEAARIVCFEYRLVRSVVIFYLRYLHFFFYIASGTLCFFNQYNRLWSFFVVFSLIQHYFFSTADTGATHAQTADAKANTCAANTSATYSNVINIQQTNFVDRHF
jgi:hypothetical protein